MPTAGFVSLVTCDVAANARQQARDRCAEAGLTCHIWTGTEFDQDNWRSAGLYVALPPIPSTELTAPN